MSKSNPIGRALAKNAADTVALLVDALAQAIKATEALAAEQANKVTGDAAVSLARNVYIAGRLDGLNEALRLTTTVTSLARQLAQDPEASS